MPASICARDEEEAEKYMNMQGKCTGPKYLVNNLGKWWKQQMGGHERKSWNEFELRGFLSRKGLWNVAREKILQDRCTLPKEEGDIVK